MTFGDDCRNFILATSCVTTQILTGPQSSLCLSLVARGVWWLPSPAARVTRRRVGTSQTQIWVVLLNAIYPRLTTNQKHYPDLGIGTWVWNFCSHFSDVISQRNQCWCCFLRLSDGWVSHVGRHRPRCRLWKSKFKFFPHNPLLAAILDFGEGYKSCLFSFKVKKSRFKHKN